MHNLSGLYLHIPFCAQKCSYCDFYSFKADDALVDRYTDALCGEIKKWGGLYDRPFDTVYFGGGTPSLLGERIIKVMNEVYNSFDISENAEITVEVNPDSATLPFLEAAKKSGVNRLSMGVQSFSDKELSILSRIHTSKDVERAVLDARLVGFNNLSLDLMIGLPESDIKTLSESIHFVTSLEPEHISAYILKVEPETVLSKRQDITFADDDMQYEQYIYMCDALKSKGYEHYEISNFAKKGFESRHNTKYWTLCEYLGIGPSAHSFIDSKRFFYPRDIKSFLTQPQTVFDGVAGGEDERIMLALRLSSGFDFKEYPKVFPFLKRLCGEKLGTLNKTVFSLTDKGMAVSNAIICEILDMIM